MKRPTEICPHCGQSMPPARQCARPDCGKEFRNRRADAVYCSRACAKVMAQRARRRRERQAARAALQAEGA